jgi:hypothetical protein
MNGLHVRGKKILFLRKTVIEQLKIKRVEFFKQLSK